MNTYDNPYYISPRKFMELLDDVIEEHYEATWHEKQHPEDIGVVVGATVKNIEQTLNKLASAWGRE
jgi:hypothetical protein